MMYTPARTVDTFREELLEYPFAAASASLSTLATEERPNQRNDPPMKLNLHLHIQNTQVARLIPQDAVDGGLGGAYGVHTSSRRRETFKCWIFKTLRYQKQPPDLALGRLILNGGSRNSMRVELLAIIERSPSSSVRRTEIKAPRSNNRNTMGVVLIPESLANRQALPGVQLTLTSHARRNVIRFKGKDLELCKLIRGTCKLDSGSDFPQYMTLPWYFAIVMDESNVLNDMAFIPWELFGTKPTTPTGDQQAGFLV